jgi:hypothetical protein
MVISIDGIESKIITCMALMLASGSQTVYMIISIA